jgi:hypothetical protein
LLEKIPDYSQGSKSPHQTTSGIDLAPVIIKPSLVLHRLEVFIYLFMLVSASIAILPFVLTAFYWPLLWLIFLLVSIVAIRTSLRNKKSSPVSFSVAQRIWYLQTPGGSVAVKPCNELVVWSALIILSVEEIVGGRKHRMVALPDSMTSEDWRRLRVWLRMALRKNT